MKVYQDHVPGIKSFPSSPSTSQSTSVITGGSHGNAFAGLGAAIVGSSPSFLSGAALSELYGSMTSSTLPQDAMMRARNRRPAPQANTNPIRVRDMKRTSIGSTVFQTMPRAGTTVIGKENLYGFKVTYKSKKRLIVNV